MYKKTIVFLVYIILVISPTLLSPMREGTHQQELTTGARRGFAIFENMDAKNLTDDNGQGIFITAPVPTIYLGGLSDFSSILNNVSTTTSHFLQNGLDMKRGRGRVIYTSNSFGLLPIQYPAIPYFPGSDYGFVIAYGAGVWQMCAWDVVDEADTYSCEPDWEATGTTMQGDTRSTSIFAEVNYTDARWDDTTSAPWFVFGATTVRNGIHYNWTTLHKHTAHRCSTSYPTRNVTKGTLVNNSRARFIPSAIPLRC